MRAKGSSRLSGDRARPGLWINAYAALTSQGQVRDSFCRAPVILSEAKDDDLTARREPSRRSRQRRIRDKVTKQAIA